MVFRIVPLFLLGFLLIIFRSSGQERLPNQLRDSAQIFGKGSISTGAFEFNTSFTPDSKVVFFSRATVAWGYINIFFSRRKGTKWLPSQEVNFTSIYRDTDPFVSPDGNTLYFISDRPLPGKPFVDYDYHLYAVNLKNNLIVTPPQLLSYIDPLVPVYPSFSSNGNLYFTAPSSSDKKDYDIYCARYGSKGYETPVKLPFNTPQMNDIDPVIASDESFIIFASTGRNGFGGSDLWVSFNSSNGWSEPVNLGDQINTPGREGAPGLSRDNRTLYFSAFRENISRPSTLQKPDVKPIHNVFNSVKNGLPNIYQIDISGLLPALSNHRR